MAYYIGFLITLAPGSIPVQILSIFTILTAVASCPFIYLFYLSKYIKVLKSGHQFCNVIILMLSGN